MTNNDQNENALKEVWFSILTQEQREGWDTFMNTCSIKHVNPKWASAEAYAGINAKGLGEVAERTR